MSEIKETLDCGGSLIVHYNGWSVVYYIPGPDRRYNGTLFTIDGKDMVLYISILQKNFEEYERLKGLLTDAENFSKHLDMGMEIRINRKNPNFNGLYLGSHKQPISTKFQLDKVVSTYSKAIGRAENLQEVMRAM